MKRTVVNNTFLQRSECVRGAKRNADHLTWRNILPFLTVINPDNPEDGGAMSRTDGCMPIQQNSLSCSKQSYTPLFEESTTGKSGRD